MPCRGPSVSPLKGFVFWRTSLIGGQSADLRMERRLRRIGANPAVFVNCDKAATDWRFMVTMMKHRTTFLASIAVALSSVVLAKGPDTTTAARAIDSILAKDWEKAKVKGNPAADDNTFVRRIYLDIIGRIPTTREAEAFLSDKDARQAGQADRQAAGSEATCSTSSTTGPTCFA
jgi:hypothetical protein